ncbi:hypothetical protein KCP73_15405 [Salmonella enterica subsp. enterica]|nr:hypothetical protein KCP73_15405 [Salmonella enterica subsp. enterica]
MLYGTPSTDGARGLSKARKRWRRAAHPHATRIRPLVSLALVNTVKRESHYQINGDEQTAHPESLQRSSTYRESTPSQNGKLIYAKCAVAQITF